MEVSGRSPGKVAEIRVSPGSFSGSQFAIQIIGCLADGSEGYDENSSGLAASNVLNPEDQVNADLVAFIGRSKVVRGGTSTQWSGKRADDDSPPIHRKRLATDGADKTS